MSRPNGVGKFHPGEPVAVRPGVGVRHLRILHQVQAPRLGARRGHNHFFQSNYWYFFQSNYSMERYLPTVHARTYWTVYFTVDQVGTVRYGIYGTYRMVP